MADRQGRSALIAGGQALALLVALALAFWGADAVARVGAQTLVARNLAEATGVLTPPDVVVQGRLFTPQVVRGAYERVDIGITGATSGPLRIDRIEARLTGVRVPFHDVLVRDVGALGVVSAATRARLTYQDLQTYFAQTGRPLSVADNGAGRLRLSGAVDVLGRTVDAVAVVTISAARGTLRITPDSVDTGAIALGAASRLLLQQRFTLTIPLGSLPFGQEVNAVAVTPDALLVDTVGYGVVVGT